MSRFEEEDQEPVAVVRTLADFALALTLVVLMLIGTRSVAQNNHETQAHAGTLEPKGRNPSLNLLLISGGKFSLVPDGASSGPSSAATLGQRWSSGHPDSPATILLEFRPNTLASDLHRALLDLQAAFGTNLARIDTAPQP
jgi:hypothetical protein